VSCVLNETFALKAESALKQEKSPPLGDLGVAPFKADENIEMLFF